MTASLVRNPKDRKEGLSNRNKIKPNKGDFQLLE